MRQALLVFLLGFGGLARPLCAQDTPEAERTDYPALLSRLCEGAAESPTLHLFAGSTLTHQGRLIPLVIVTNAPERIQDTLRVMVLCRQHGDEPYPTEAAMALLERWARASPDQLKRFDRVTLLLFPLVNPDGAIQGRRENGAGVDLNRDWQARTQPETRCVETLFERWQPHLVVDVHGFRRDDPGSPFYRRADLVEMLAEPGPARQPLQHATRALRQMALAATAQAGWPMQPAESALSRLPGTLAHRHFAHDHQAVALLVESGRQRKEPYVAFIEALVQYLNANFAEQKPRLDQLRGLTDWTAPVLEEAVTAPAEPQTPAPSPWPPGPLRPVLLLYGYVMAAYFCGVRRRMRDEG
jgi:hypothetical protein